jgi:hypothetical protein
MFQIPSLDCIFFFFLNKRNKVITIVNEFKILHTKEVETYINVEKLHTCSEIQTINITKVLFNLSYFT